jgi:transcriptional regulator with XRE-family HTH domain
MTLEAVQLLGARVSVARRERKWTLRDLADRVGVTLNTMRKVERGDPTVGLGVAFEAAAITGVPLFDEDISRRRLDADRLRAQMAVLPKQVHKPTKVNDDF